MANDQSYYRGLLADYIAGSIDTGKLPELFDFIRDEPTEANELLEELGGQEYVLKVTAEATSIPFDQQRTERMRKRLLAAIQEKQPVRRIGWQKWMAAASVILVLGAGSFYWYSHHKNGKDNEVVVTPAKQNDVLPGGNKAILTLSNGQKIILDSAANGRLSLQGNAAVIKTDSGKLAYQSMGNSTGKTEAEVFNTLSTPRGGQYQLTLPDGTKVWLNAASSITYPTTFTGKERKVEITGEAYFEVVHNATKPFKVKAGNQLIEDIGTAFNVNSYPDETSIKTTLLEGSVKVSTATANAATTLQPGQQTQYNGSTIQLLNDVNTDEVIAWKNGLFNFNHADLQTVMRQLERWYDIDVKYEGNIPAKTFRGKITRDLKLSQVINLLREVEVKFRLEGRTLVVTQ